MTLSRFLSRSPVVRASIVLSRHTPESVVYWLARSIAGLIVRTKPPVYRIVANNVRQVLGLETRDPAVADAARQIFATAVRGYYDLYRLADKSREDLEARMEMPAETRDIAASLRHHKQGTILVFPHLSSFDLGGRALVPYVPPIQLFTLAAPPSGFQIQNDLRGRSGVTVTPLSPAALRQAFRHLGQGGVVAIAGDRPVSKQDAPHRFFGRLAHVPSAHVRLAARTGAQVVMAYCVFAQDTQRYQMIMEPPLDLDRSADRERAIEANMRLVLGALERIILHWVGQWQMFVPVWS